MRANFDLDFVEDSLIVILGVQLLIWSGYRHSAYGRVLPLIRLILMQLSATREYVKHNYYSIISLECESSK